MGVDAFQERLRAAIARVPDDASRPPPDARVGAVLALFESTDRGPGVVLTRRRRDLRAHPGQLSFPGGRVDAGETFEQAALREAREEIALRTESVDIFGTAPTFYIPPSRFWVVPVVGWWRDRHRLDPNPWEVDEVLHVPLVTLVQDERLRWVSLSGRGAAWAWQLDDDLLWGATAMLVAALLDVVSPGWAGGRRPTDLGRDRQVRPWEHFPSWQPPLRLQGIPEVAAAAVPVVGSRQARQVARLLQDDAGVSFAQVLEHAARPVTEAVRQLAGGDVSGVAVTVLAGPGGNGAAGAAAARLLAAAGAHVAVWLTGALRVPDQLNVLRTAGVAVAPFGEGATAGDVVVDALLGVGARPPAHGAVAAAITWLQRHDVPVVAVDLPSGLHPDAGVVGPCVSADVTITLGAAKAALLDLAYRAYVGDLYLADLGVPADVWRRADVEPVTVFGRGPLVRLV